MWTNRERAPGSGPPPGCARWVRHSPGPVRCQFGSDAVGDCGFPYGRCCGSQRRLAATLLAVRRIGGHRANQLFWRPSHPVDFRKIAGRFLDALDGERARSVRPAERNSAVPVKLLESHCPPRRSALRRIGSAGSIAARTPLYTRYMAATGSGQIIWSGDAAWMSSLSTGSSASTGGLGRGSAGLLSGGR